MSLTPENLAQVAQPAIQGGKHAGVQIRRLLAGAPTEPFKYFDKGTMATIGRSDAVVQFPFGLRLRGLLAWLSWLGLHIVELMGGRNRLASADQPVGALLLVAAQPQHRGRRPGRLRSRLGLSTAWPLSISRPDQACWEV